MAIDLRSFLQFLYFALIFGSSLCQPWTNSMSSCPASSSSPKNLYLNIFTELTSRYHDLAESLITPPLIQGTDTSVPAYEFEGHGSGFSLAGLSEKIREASCLHNEITFSGRIYIRDSQSDGPLLELAYSGGLESGRPIYVLHMDARANEIILAYEHGGRLHSEIIPIRLISGRWRQYSVSLSGNLLSFYFDCQLEVQRLVPLPDYCHNESSVILNIASSVNGGLEFSGTTGLYVYVQNLAVEFGPGGVTRICPKVVDECPTCGQFLTYLEQLSESEQKIRHLEQLVSELEEGCIRPVDPSSLNCIINVGSVIRTIPNKNFLVTSSTTICYCDSGKTVCTTLSDSMISNGGNGCNGGITTGNPMNPPTTPNPLGTCTSSLLEATGTLDLGEEAYILTNNAERCIIYRCISSAFGLVLSPPRPVACDRSVLSACLASFTETQRRTSLCCGICTECNYRTCPLNSGCQLDNNRIPQCNCLDGFTRNESGSCIDLDECAVGRTQGGHNCPDLSNCTNTVGSFTCRCIPGYTLGSGTCRDIDECAGGTNNCSANAQCENTIGSFNCNCDQGYAKDDRGVCQPVCDDPCQNSGTCVAPNTCSCQPGFEGSACQDDIDECASSSRNTCLKDELATCVNTKGGYFCRCNKGYVQVHAQCVNVDECSLNIHNCIDGATCVDTVGSYQCLCMDEEQRIRNCIGSCRRKGVIYADNTHFLNKCLNCSCLGGEFNCIRAQCDCSDVNRLPAECCPQCFRRDCSILGGSVLIRPGSSWMNPSNRCERFDCPAKLSENLVAVRVNISTSCPKLNCPETIVPAGKCCPICMLPECSVVQEGRTVSVQNGCKIYTCQNLVWSLTRSQMCPEPSCLPQDVVFFRNGCCPVCRHEILGTSQMQCSKTTSPPP